MGTCCSCHIGTAHGYLVEEEDEARNNNNNNDDDIVLRGDAGARVRLRGSSDFVSMFSQQGRKGVNQDAMTVWERFAGDKEMFFCAVFDGHGPSGHKVSRYIRDFLPARLSLLYKQPIVDGTDAAVIDVEADPNSKSKNPYFLSWKARLTKCFNDMDDQLEDEGSIESYCSGTTSVCVLKKGEHLIIANLGDSRAVLCTRDESGQLVPEQLTVDLKPSLPEEAERIRRCKGRVLAMDEEPNVYRVWMPNEDCPGLAMARAFGDFCLKDYGLISTPEITYRKLTDKDEFVVLATDGIWDALSNDEVVKIVASAGNGASAAKVLVEKAVWTWKHRFPRAKIDDCAAVCLFFKGHHRTPLLPKSQVKVDEVDARSHTGSAKSDDALDTVLNCDTKDEKNGADRLRKRRVRNNKVDYVGS